MSDENYRCSYYYLEAIRSPILKGLRDKLWLFKLEYLVDYFLKMNSVPAPRQKTTDTVSSPVVPKWSSFDPAGDIWQCLQTFLVLRTGGLGGMLLVRGQRYWLTSYVYRQPLMTRSFLAPNNNSVEAEKSCGSQ